MPWFANHDGVYWSDFAIGLNLRVPGFSGFIQEQK
jgi:hypothetical protein